MKRLLLAASCLGLIAGAAQLANAATNTDGTLTVTATVTVACSTDSPTLAFGNVNKDGATASHDIAVTCDGAPISPTIGLGAGLNASHVVSTTRAMASGSNYMDYDLHLGSYTGTVWDNDTNTQAVSNMSGGSGSVTVYGKVPSGQYVPAGSYSDTVAITLNY